MNTQQARTLKQGAPLVAVQDITWRDIGWHPYGNDHPSEIAIYTGEMLLFDQFVDGANEDDFSLWCWHERAATPVVLIEWVLPYAHHHQWDNSDGYECWRTTGGNAIFYLWEDGWLQVNWSANPGEQEVLAGASFRSLIGIVDDERKRNLFFAQLWDAWERGFAEGRAQRERERS